MDPQSASSSSAALRRLINGFRISQALAGAAARGSADLLADGPRASDDLAATAAHPEALCRLLRALATVHDRFFHDFNHQPHAAHSNRSTGRQSPAAVLGWVHGAWCDPVELDRLFRLRTTRVLDANGSVRFRHWRRFGERSLAGERAAVWLTGETLTIEVRAEALIPDRVALEPDGHRLREVADPAPLPHGHPSPQPFLSPVDEAPWQPARRLAPDRARRPRGAGGRQAPLFASTGEATAR